MKYLILLLLLFTPSAPVDAAPEKVVKSSLVSQGKKRTYYLFVPENRKAPAPLVVLLHGSKRNGLSLVDKWKELAKKEGVVIVAPDSIDSAMWSTPTDGPQFLHELVESVKAEHTIDPHRVYLFGHSAGASFALLMSLFESEYFAATAVHAGALRPETFELIDSAKRKIPISIQVGTKDAFFPLDVVRATRDALDKRGFPVSLTEMANHDHWYYDLAPKINAAAWEFLKSHRLDAAPRYEQYDFGKANNGKTDDRKTDQRSRAGLEAYNEGVRLHRTGDLRAAADAYTRAVTADANIADAYTNRGVIRLDGKDYDAAIADFTRAIELDPQAALPYVNRGNAYRALKRHKEAIADYTKSIEMKPSVEAYFNRAVAHDEGGNRAPAFFDYTRAVELDPKLAHAYAYRGIIFLRDGKDVDAQRDFDRAFALDPKLRAELETYINQLRGARVNK